MNAHFPKIIAAYTASAGDFARQYNSLTTEQVLPGLQFMTEPNGGFIELKKYSGRTLFYSDATGPFWSIGVNAFMNPSGNDPLTEVIARSSYKTVYEDQFRSLTQNGFNTLGGWSNVDRLNDRLPFGIVLFDASVDEDMPMMAPLINVKGGQVPAGDSGEPCPIRDPYNKQYQAALDKYIKAKVEKYRESKSLLCYWIGHEFGWGDSEVIDFSDYLHSKDISLKLQEWLKQNGKTNPTKQDLREFATVVVSDWFALVVQTIKKYDPNHLISSPKLSVYDRGAHLHKPLDLGHFESFRGHFDLLSVDTYTAEEAYPIGLVNDLRGISYMLDLPVLVAEFGTRQKMDGWTNTPGAPKFVASQQERTDRYRSQVMQLFEEPWIVGAHWFKWGDHFSQRHQMNQGMVTVKGGAIAPYTELVDGMRRVNLDIQSRVQ